MLSALTFLPALLALFGKAAFWPFIPKHGMVSLPDDLTQPVKGFWPRQARFVARHARAGVDRLHRRAAGRALSALLQLKADGVPSSDLVLGASEARDGQEVLAEHFPAGSGSPGLRRSSPRRTWPTRSRSLADSDGIESVAAASEDSPTGQATVEVEDGEAVLRRRRPARSRRARRRPSRTATCC